LQVGRAGLSQARPARIRRPDLSGLEGGGKMIEPLLMTWQMEYRNSVLPRHAKARVAVEQGSAFGWHQYVDLDGKVIAMQTSEPHHRSRTS
nr:hypothetical protein [Actinomycetota bacterium]